MKLASIIFQEEASRKLLGNMSKNAKNLMILDLEILEESAYGQTGKLVLVTK